MLNLSIGSLSISTLTAVLLVLCSPVFADEESSSTDSQYLPSLTAFSISNGLTYSVKSLFGADEQDINIRVDIAQPFVWVVSSNTSITCMDINNSSCIANGVFNSSSSNTSNVILDEQDLRFLNGLTVNGSIVDDSVLFLNPDDSKGDDDNSVVFSLPHLDFIEANRSGLGVGALGLAGKILDEPLSGLPNSTFLDTLKNQGLINSSSYSFFAIDDQFLKLTFGGLDPNEFINDLVLFKNIPFKSDHTGQLYYNYPIIPLTAISVVSTGGSKVALSYDQYPVLLDSRFTYSLLPFKTIIALAVQLNAYYSNDNNVWLLKCSTGDLGASLSFQFGNATISVPVSNFMRELLDENDEQIVFDDGAPACILTILPENKYGYSILGTNFLRSAFFAVDNDNQQIAIAQAYNEYYINLTETQSQKLENMTKTAMTSIPFESSLIQSSTIPFAVPNNLTEYSTFTFSYNSQLSISTIPDDITAGVSHGTIYTGRQSTHRSSDPDETASGPPRIEAAGISLRGDVSFTFLGLLLSFLI